MIGVMRRRRNITREGGSVIEDRPAQIRNRPSGHRVVVLVPGVYNGPNHKSLGHCEAGQEIYVAGGAYAESLIRDGLVADADAEGVAIQGAPVPHLSPQGEPHGESGESSPDGGDDDGPGHVSELAGLGVQRRAIEALEAAGLINREAFRAAYEAAGPAHMRQILLDIRGIGESTANTILEWAGIPAEGQ